MKTSSRSRHDKSSFDLHPRGITRKEAAAFVGLSPSAFDAARARGEYPGPTLAGRRYDKKLLDRALDRLSGIADGALPTDLDTWRARRAAR